MTVRAKMSCGGIIAGSTGSSLMFGAVYEGTKELQLISENAIFGEATPNGSADFSGPINGDTFVVAEEYYFDFYANPSGADCPPNDSAVLASVPMTKVFRGAYNYAPVPMASYRFVARHGEVHAQIAMSIANPAAIAYLDECNDFTVVVRLAVGRRSDAEIAMRRKMLDDAKEEMAKSKDPASYTNWIAQMERKLARAEGVA